MDGAETRNHGAWHGRPRLDSVELPGWSARSVWGFDDGSGSYYAQLWRDTDEQDPPTIWLSGITRPMPHPPSVVLALMEATGAGPGSAVRALGLMHPQPMIRPRDEVDQAARNLHAGPDPFSTGACFALGWLLGLTDQGPGSWLPWSGGRPKAEHVAIEHCLVTARIYRQAEPEQSAWIAGADGLLAWALRISPDLPF